MRIGSAFADRCISVQTEAETPSKDAADVNDATAELTESAEKVVNELKEKWNQLDEKPAAIGITASALVAIYALNGVLKAVDSIPIVAPALELVGTFVTAWFVYRYLIFGPDREELKENIQSFWAKVSGK